MKIMVLGSTGFIGRNLITELERGTIHDIYGFSRTEGLDLLDYDKLSSKIQKIKPDVIYNVASHGGSLHYVKEFAAEVFNDNVQMALNLYRAVKQHSPNTKIIQPFSNCSYPGDSSIQEENNWLGGKVHDSIFSFGNSKRSIYYLSKCYEEQYGIKSVNILFPNTYGPGDSCDPNHTHALNGMIIRMIQAKQRGDKEFVVWGTGSPIREWAYVDDFIDVLVYALDIESLNYPVNFGQEKGYSIAESAGLIKDALDFSGDIKFDTTKTDGDPVKILSSAKFKSVFPNFKFYDHELGIKNTVKYYKDKLLS